MIVVVDSITWKQVIEFGQVKIKSLLEYLFELSSKSKTFCKRCEDKDVIADGSRCASSMTRKHWAKRGESGENKTHVSKASPCSTLLLTQ